MDNKRHNLKVVSKKIIIVNPFGIGDVVFSTPVIENLKIAYPDSFIGYLCNARTAPILQTNPKIDKVFIYEKDDWRKLWKESKFKCIVDFIKFLSEIKKCKFDLAVDLSLGRHYSFFLWLFGVGKRYGFNYHNRGLFLTDKIDIEGYQDKHVIEYYLDLLHFMNLNPTAIEPKVYIDTAHSTWAEDFLKSKGINSDDYLIGVVPGGGVSWGKAVDIRRWAKEKFTQLADKIIGNFPVKMVIFGDKFELELCSSIVSGMKNKAVMIVGQTDLLQFVALLSKCN
ncbi:MAG TPA: lipopolysaccharide heptosyltransferase family protein, partial [Candidatus Omnitrophica bacterium]|nr:lipopolysaccharide heptosyltransferase family protein [Candidatus Omnitrophota bacterium]